MLALGTSPAAQALYSPPHTNELVCYTRFTAETQRNYIRQ
jgi:hypothetical protein